MRLGAALLRTVEANRRRTLYELLRQDYAGGEYWPLAVDGAAVIGGRDMEVVGGVTFSGGRASLDGTTGFFRRTASESWTLNNNFAIRMLVRPRSSGSSTKYLFGGLSGATWPSIRRGGAAVNRLAVFSNASTVVESGTDYLPPLIEHDVVLVRQGTGAGHTKLYVNGVAVSLATDAAVDFGDAASQHFIGARAGSLFADVDISHVAWAPYPFSQAHIRQHIDAAQLVSTTFQRLSWRPPPLTVPTVIHVAPGAQQVELAADQDYVIVLPPVALNNAFAGGLKIDGHGARNVVVIGGEINMTQDPGSGYGVATRGVGVFNVQGTVHLEGLYVHGPWCSDGIDVFTEPGFAPGIVQIQCCRIDVLTPNQDIGTTHPDIVQIGCAAEVRVDRLSGSSPYQGCSLIPADTGPATIGPTTWRRVNLTQTIDGAVPAGKMFWQTDPSNGPVTYDRCYLLPLAARATDNSVWPDASQAPPRNAVTDATTREVSYPNDTAHLAGKITPGVPPGGEFAIPGGGRGRSGIGYLTPGYV